MTECIKCGSETLLVFKMKKMQYQEALLFLYKNHNHKLPSLTSTQYLGTKAWYYAESNLDNYDNIKTEHDWLSYFKQIYHDGSPQDITKCSLT